MEKNTKLQAILDAREKRAILVRECEIKCRAAATEKYSSKEFSNHWIGFFVEWLKDSQKEPVICSSKWGLGKEEEAKGDYFCRQIGKLLENKPELIE